MKPFLDHGPMRAAVDAAQRAVYAAEAEDAEALAAAMVNGGTEPEPRARTEKAEARCGMPRPAGRVPAAQ